MKKTFYLSYTTITGHEVKLTFTEPFAFAEAFENALNDEYVNQGSYKISTEEK